VVSARSRVVRSSFACAALASSASLHPVHRRAPAPGGQLHQRRRVWDLAVDRDPAEPSPGDRVRHLRAQAFIAQPVAELQKHHPQVDLHRRRRTAHPRVEERHERREEHRVIQQNVDPRQRLRQAQHLRRQNRLPQAHLDRPRPQHRHSQTSPPSHRDHDPVIPAHNSGDAPSEIAALQGKTLRLLQVEVTNGQPNGSWSGPAMLAL